MGWCGTALSHMAFPDEEHNGVMGQATLLEVASQPLLHLNPTKPFTPNEP